MAATASQIVRGTETTLPGLLNTALGGTLIANYEVIDLSYMWDDPKTIAVLVLIHTP